MSDNNVALNLATEDQIVAELGRRYRSFVLVAVALSDEGQSGHLLRARSGGCDWSHTEMVGALHAVCKLYTKHIVGEMQDIEHAQSDDSEDDE